MPPRKASHFSTSPPKRDRKKTNNPEAIKESDSEDGDGRTELTKLEIDLAKENFGFYDAQK